jgi:hypothetical protein
LQLSEVEVSTSILAGKMIAFTVVFDHFGSFFQVFDVLKCLSSCFVVCFGYLIVFFSFKLQKKLRIAKGLAALPGPKGVFMLGLLPAFFKNNHRIYEYLVCLWFFFFFFFSYILLSYSSNTILFIGRSHTRTWWTHEDTMASFF